MRVMPKAAVAAVLGALALPGSALAVDTTSTVSGAVGSELSLAVAAPAAMTLTHATPGTTSSVVTVTSTALSWTLSIREDGGDGYMGRVTGSGPATLANPLQWKLSTSGSYNNLSGTAATVTTGSLVGTATVDFRQPLTATESVQSGDTYNLTATYTVT